ncbi:MAG: hypothetical protein KBD01_04490 [Acidobacteria bacterium]|nr:hypothetical protein [Acidobacteriota bacterium]
MDTLGLTVANVLLALLVLVPVAGVLVAVAAELMAKSPAPAGGGMARFRVLAGGRAGAPRASRRGRGASQRRIS